MSRSALARQELQQAAAARQRLLDPNNLHHPYHQEDDILLQREPKANEVPLWGNPRTFNINTMLYENILSSRYFRSLYDYKTYHEVVDEIYNTVDHAEPLSPGTARIPSSCFCLLVKFYTMRLTVKQLRGLLNHKDSPFIRCVGFLYLRYACPPEDLWEWLEPYLEDPEEFNASANPNILTTMGKYLRSLLEDQNYFGTILPRIPKRIQDELRVKLLLYDRFKEREERNLPHADDLYPGKRVRAMYADADNEPAMYDAVIDSVEEGRTYCVTFTEYGNSERVKLGDIEFIYKEGRRSKDRDDRRRSRSPTRSRDRGHKKHTSRSRSREGALKRRSRSRSRSYENVYPSGQSMTITDSLMEEVRRRDRERAQAHGKDYASRPASYKGSLSLKVDRYTTRPRSRSRSPQRRRREQSRNRSRSPNERDSRPPSSRRPRGVSEAAKKRREDLQSVYGDASSGSLR